MVFELLREQFVEKPISFGLSLNVEALLPFRRAEKFVQVELELPFPVKPSDRLVHERNQALAPRIAEDAFDQAHTASLRAERIDHYKCRVQSSFLSVDVIEQVDHVVLELAANNRYVGSGHWLLSLQDPLQVIRPLLVRLDENERHLQASEAPILPVPPHGFQGNERRTDLPAGVFARTSKPVHEQQAPIEAPRMGNHPSR